MVGDREKVPCIRHDFQKSEWTAIGRVLVFGFKEINYFPISLSKAFLASCLFGKESIDYEFLLSSFRFYVTSEERETFDKTRKGDCESDDDDVLEFLGHYKTFTMPTKGNINSILSQLKHQELIQRPRYVAQCWVPVWQNSNSTQSSAAQLAWTTFFRPRCRQQRRLLECYRVNQ